MINNKLPYIECPECGSIMIPIWFIEEEVKYANGYYPYKTGRKRRSVSHLECPDCFTKECVDDSFDQPWE